MRLSSLDFWRLREDLPITSAALLAADLDPGKIKLKSVGRTKDYEIDQSASHLSDLAEYQEANSKFKAAFLALRDAIMNNQLQAKFAFKVETLGNLKRFSEERGPPIIKPAPKGSARLTDLLIGETAYKGIKSNRALQFLRFTDLVYWQEPNWQETTASFRNLQIFFEENGLTPDFYFPKGNTDDLSNKEGPRYSPTLALAVAAWKEVKKPKPGKSIKTTLLAWLNTNKHKYIKTIDSSISSTAVLRISEVVNWEKQGGVPKTPNSDDDPTNQSMIEKPTENYIKIDHKALFKASGQNGRAAIAYFSRDKEAKKKSS